MYKNNYPHKRYRITLDFLKTHIDTNEEILDLGVSNPFSEMMTENNYKVIVYYRDYGSRYDRVIGYNNINSIKINN